MFYISIFRSKILRAVDWLVNSSKMLVAQLLAHTQNSHYCWDKYWSDTTSNFGLNLDKLSFTLTLRDYTLCRYVTLFVLTYFQTKMLSIFSSGEHKTVRDFESTPSLLSEISGRREPCFMVITLQSVRLLLNQLLHFRF